MNFEKDKQEVEQIIKNAKTQIDALDRIQKATLARVPKEHLKGVTENISDLNQMFRNLKNGDVNAINNLMSKYADFNR